MDKHWYMSDTWLSITIVLGHDLCYFIQHEGKSHTSLAQNGQKFEAHHELPVSIKTEKNVRLVCEKASVERS